MCPEECAAVNRAFGALPNAEELACCDCGEGFIGMECTTRRMKLGAACGVGTECDGTMQVGCAAASKQGDAVCKVSVHSPLFTDLSSR